MPRADYKTCRVCGRHESEIGPLSHSRLCAEHSAQRFSDNLDALKTMTGPYALHWRRRVAASVGAFIRQDLDATQERT